MLQQITEMLELQNKLNNFTNGDNWKSGMTNKGKSINWKTAIFCETAELIDSTPWKHWKNIEGKSDIDNIKIETIDNYHFLMSDWLIENEIPVLADMINAIFEQNLAVKVFDFQELNKTAKKLALVSLEADVNEKPIDVESSVTSFALLMNEAQLSFTELYEIYISKNVLNVFRQNNGYKEGTYKKEWGDVEDNVVLTNIKSKLTSLTYENLYAELEKEYKKVI